MFDEILQKLTNFHRSWWNVMIFHGMKQIWNYYNFMMYAWLNLKNKQSLRYKISQLFLVLTKQFTGRNIPFNWACLCSFLINQIIENCVSSKKSILSLSLSGKFKPNFKFAKWVGCMIIQAVVDLLWTSADCPVGC
jgi:hypothetical protein